MDSQQRTSVVGLVAAALAYLLTLVALGGDVTLIGVTVFVAVYAVAMVAFDRLVRKIW